MHITGFRVDGTEAQEAISFKTLHSRDCDVTVTNGKER